MVHLYLLPDLVASLIFLVFFLLVLLLYRRWRTRNYFVLASASGGAAVVYFLFFVTRLLTEDDFILALQSTISLVAVGGMFSAFYYFFHPVKKKDLLVSVGFGVLVFLSATTYAFSSVAGAAVSLVTALSFVILTWLKWVPVFPKRLYFQIASILFIGSFILAHTGILLSLEILSFLASLLAVIGYFALLLVIYSRIVDMVESVSISAVTDGLTGLYNKSYLFRKLTQYLTNGQAKAVIFSDIDNFKRLNDTQGHHVGDDILKLVAQAMKETFQEVGIVGRYGGEEMVAVVINSKVDPAFLAETFRARVEELTSSIYPVTVSVGVSFYSEELDAHGFIKNADSAMYSAKHQGKNQVVVA